MIDATFTFSQRGAHYLQCPSRRDYTRLPEKLSKLLSSKQVAQVHHVALGFENSFLVTYRDRNGLDIVESQGLPEELNDFLYARDSQSQPLRSVSSLRLVLGAYNASFFVHDRSSCLWMNLPTALLIKLQARIKDGLWTDKPRLVALGAENDFVLITEKHAAVWNLTHYRTLSHALQTSKTEFEGIKEIENIVLHPYRYHSYISLSRNGVILHNNLPEWSTAAVEGMKGPISRDLREADVRKRQADLARRPSLRERDNNRRDSNRQLQEWARVKREWNGQRGNMEQKASAKGVKLSLSLSISAAGIKGGFGKLLG